MVPFLLQTGFVRTYRASAKPPDCISLRSETDILKRFNHTETSHADKLHICAVPTVFWRRKKRDAPPCPHPRVSDEHKSTERVIILSRFSFLCWMCAVDDKRPTRRNNSSSGSSNVFIITAAEGSPEYRGKTEKGFTNTDRAWLPKRQHPAPDLLSCSL